MNQQATIPTLYYYEHCPYCIRVLTFAGLAKVALHKVVLLNDDEQTPIKMIGAKMLPILAANSDSFIPESLDIIEQLSREYDYPLEISDSLRQSVEALLYEQRIAIYSLMMPRCVQLPLKEFATQAAIDYFVNKKTATIGDFTAALQNSPAFITALEAGLSQVSELFDALSQKPSSDASIMLFSALYGIFYVKDFSWPAAAKNFMQTMGDASQQPVFEQVCQPI